MQKIRVFLLDDHAIVRHGLRALLEAEPDIEVVGEAGNVVDGLSGVLEHRPDVALLDARLPDGSGVDVARVVSAQAPEVRMLMLSSYDDEPTLVAAFSAGVHGYVLKQIAAEKLLSGIRDVAAGKSLVAPAVAARMMDRIRRQDQAEKQQSPTLENLTPQQQRILRLIGEGLTNREIGAQLFLAEKTIKNNVTALLAALGVSRRTQAAVIAAQLWKQS
ncbi:response regulator [Nocardioides yefusunii]|uniref:Response regulator n=1 Tax=Nocardioides yefusunii TaxID=2500546 RepID=A0ABW1R0L4_9ACTN|nr:response regulator transcription factor [Nocardioides yefusunii]